MIDPGQESGKKLTLGNEQITRIQLLDKQQREYLPSTGLAFAQCQII